ncbi:glycoside hydrolase family 88 protein, partial [Salmonella enterica subsp. enterica serovar Montevideo]|nr:glycoside hydrolase family 88 protein [Salmonella enterica subsp. enterica serovar Montevideo]
LGVIGSFTYTEKDRTNGAGDYNKGQYYGITAGPAYRLNDWARLTLAYRYEETRNPAYLPWLETWAEWAMNEMPRTDHGGMQHIT